MDWKKALVGVAPLALGAIGYAAYRKAKGLISPDPAEIPGTAGPIISMKTGIQVQPSNDADVVSADNVVTAADEQPAGTVEVSQPPVETPQPSPSEPAADHEGSIPNDAEFEEEKQVVVPVPLQPFGLQCPQISTSGEWDVEWLPTENAARYSVRESSNGGDWKIVYQGSDTKFHVRGKMVGQYSYAVTAWNNAGKASPPSETVTCKVIAAPKMEPATDTEDLIRIILTDGQTYTPPSALDEWVLNNVAKMPDSADVYRILALAGGTTALEGA